MAAIVGVGAGLGAVAFIEIIDFFRNLFFVRGQSLLSFLGEYYIIVLPIVGGAIVGPLLYFFAPEARGTGVPEVMISMETRGGRIPLRVVIGKIFGSAITIGSGGSVGREGPIVQIGAGLGSVVGTRLRLNQQRTLTLVASGSAAGIAATFNAPIAGVMFALEVLLGEYTVHAFGTMVFAAVSASVVSRLFLGANPAFVVPEYTLVSSWEILLYLGLGIVGALVAGAFVRTFDVTEKIFGRIPIPPYSKAIVGGLLIGMIGLFWPRALGTGFPAIEDTLSGGLGVGLLLALILAKILATSITLSSGFSGGVFAPALFIGAVLGGAYGKMVHDLFPDITATSGAYATVGMGAVFAAAARAPITSILMLFEMTLDYRIMLPLMFTTVVATVVAGIFEPESIYTLRLVRRGINFGGRSGGVGRMHDLPVDEVMTPAEDTVQVDLTTSLSELASIFQRTHHHGVAVMDEEGNLAGVVTIGDLERGLSAAKPDATVADIYTSDVMTTYPDELLGLVVKRAGGLDVGRIPVVDRQDPRRLLGMLHRGDIIEAYSKALSRRDARVHHLERRRIEHLTGTRLIEFDLDSRDGAVGMTLRELDLPPDALIISIHRKNRDLVPRGDTRLHAGDHLVALAPADEGVRLQRCLRRGRSTQSSQPPPR